MISFENTETAFRHKSNASLRKAYWLFKLVGSPLLVKLGKFKVNLALKLHIPIGWALRWNIFEQFCGGETIAECAQTTKVLDEYNVGTILDYSVEGKESEEDFDFTTEELQGTISTASGNDFIPFCVFKVSGISRFKLLEKVNSGKELSASEKREWQDVVNRVDALCKSAHDAKTPLFIDAEESWVQDAIDGLANSMMEKYNTKGVFIYNTLQMYRHDRLEYLKKSLETAKTKGYLLGYKLVRGAYMEKERDRAEEKGYPSPIQVNKAASDRDFNAALEFCCEHIDAISICAGSHNEQSALHLLNLMAKCGIDKSDKRVYFAQLFGMSDHISFNLSNAGYNVAKYVPYGPIREVVPYLIRRAEENTSVEGQTSRELSLIQKEMTRRSKAS